MSYTTAAIVGVLAAAVLDLVVLRTRLLRLKGFWVAYAIIVFFQLVSNGLLTGLRIVRYDPAAIIGWRIAYAPIEDLLFGFAMVLTALSLWTRWRTTPAATRVPSAPNGATTPPGAAPAPPPPRGDATARRPGD